MTAQKLYQRMKQRHDTIHQDWVDQAKSDTEYGGKNFDANIKTAKTGLKRFGSPRLHRILDETGLGSHPEMIRLFWKLGQLAPGQTPKAAPKRSTDLGELFYPNFPNATA